MSDSKAFNSFAEFYPYYLEEHSDLTCRRLHYLGSFLVLVVAGYALITGRLALLWLLPVIGYGFAWLGHFKFEKNRPATFKYPLYSLMGDWVMLKDMLIGRIRF
ncbi:Mpo1-like protein [Marinobacter mobilis]|uniref:Mpo1-like protein n=1 Tax=Marinobacter mobilis TaxID=488533 RepID=UPI0035C6696E